MRAVKFFLTDGDEEEDNPESSDSESEVGVVLQSLASLSMIAFARRMKVLL